MFCLDTNVVIFAINERKPKVVERLHRELVAGSRMFIPAIVMFELEYGCAKSERRAQSRRALEIFLSAEIRINRLSTSKMRAKPAKYVLFLKRRGRPIGPSRHA